MPGRPLPEDFQPTGASVICGRGGASYNSPGNRRFRIIVERHLDQYAKAETKGAKSQIVNQVFDVVHSCGGNFIRRKSGRWYLVPDATAREKIGSHFRDCLHDRYRSAAKQKIARRRERKQASRRAMATEPNQEEEAVCFPKSPSGESTDSTALGATTQIKSRVQHPVPMKKSSGGAVNSLVNLAIPSSAASSASSRATHTRRSQGSFRFSRDIFDEQPCLYCGDQADSRDHANSHRVESASQPRVKTITSSIKPLSRHLLQRRLSTIGGCMSDVNEEDLDAEIDRSIFD